MVTRDWLTLKIKENPEKVIGRALVAIFRNQTSDEQSQNETKFLNGVGFCAGDARVGSVCAKFFMEHGTLTEKLMKGWLKRNAQGLPRIVKYASQLNRIAVTNQKQTTPCSSNQTSLING